jgi:transposase
MTTRRRFSPTEKAQVVMETLVPKANVAEICRAHGVHSSQVYEWKRTALAGMRLALTGSASPDPFLRAENARLKKLVAESALVIDRLQDTLGGTAEGKNDGGGS